MLLSEIWQSEMLLSKMLLPEKSRGTITTYAHYVKFNRGFV